MRLLNGLVEPFLDVLHSFKYHFSKVCVWLLRLSRSTIRISILSFAPHIAGTYTFNSRSYNVVDVLFRKYVFARAMHGAHGGIEVRAVARESPRSHTQTFQKIDMFNHVMHGALGGIELRIVERERPRGYTHTFQKWYSKRCRTTRKGSTRSFKRRIPWCTVVHRCRRDVHYDAWHTLPNAGWKDVLLTNFRKYLRYQEIFRAMCVMHRNARLLGTDAQRCITACVY